MDHGAVNFGRIGGQGAGNAELRGSVRELSGAEISKGERPERVYPLELQVADLAKDAVVLGEIVMHLARALDPVLRPAAPTPTPATVAPAKGLREPGCAVGYQLQQVALQIRDVGDVVDDVIRRLEV